MMPSPLPDLPQTVLVATSPGYDHAALGRTLGRYGYQVRAVGRGDEALAIARDGDVALTILDVALAGSANLELCQRLATLCGPAVPLYLLSDAPNPDEQARASEVGAAAYLPLDFDTDDLADKILLHLQATRPASVAPGQPTMATLEVNYHTMLSGSPDAIMLMQRGSNRLLDVNRRAREMFGLTESELLQADLPSLCPPRQPDGRSSNETLDDYVTDVIAGAVSVFPLRMRHSGGRAIDCELRMVPLNAGEHRIMHVRVVDVTRHNLEMALREGKNKLLEMIARSAPLDATLRRLMALIESQSDGAICTVILLAEDGVSVESASGPGMPRAYLDALVGLPIGPAAGSCGTAMYRRETVIVSDLMADPLWAPYRQVAAQFGLRACWSMPVLLDSETVLGSFAMYYREVRQPTEDDLSLLGTGAHMAGIAISRTRREAELLRHREHLEELVAARTAQLRQSRDRAEQMNEELTAALEHLSVTQEELVRRDKLAALGALVAGVAHELNTPIGNSLVMASTMAERTDELRRELVDGLRRSALESYLDQAASADQVVVRNLNRAAALVTSFRQIAVDSASSQRARFVLGDQVAQLLQSLEADLRRQGITLEENVDHWLEMDSYPGPLVQALQNMIENSVVHGFDGGRKGTIAISAHDSGNGEITIELGDDGLGIAAAHLPRIYDPFFTTRMGAGGSGLGLYITHNIVTGVLGGHIEVHSEAGRGTRFTLRLPKIAPV